MMTGPAHSTVYRALNGSPAENLEKVIELTGGVEQLIGTEDVVVIKPNVQWWNQGAPNLSAVKKLIDLIMSHPKGFCGEVVLAENCHRGSTPWNSVDSGWGREFVRNSDLAAVSCFNDLGRVLKREYGDAFSVCHWINVDVGARRSFGPADGCGYVYCDGSSGTPLLEMDNGAIGDDYRRVMMTYPVFDTDRGTRVDFRNGIWADGEYTRQSLKFINFSALNHHSVYCGITASIKNHLGISDLSGGPDPYQNGKLTAR
jgi:hypothetical protein